jgi:hypothetical protein
MGYFSNGTEGEMYEEEYCSKCVHAKGCAVWHAHMAHNYAECNKDDSILHLLIPRLKPLPPAPPIFNDKCLMFYEDPHRNQLSFDL